MNNRNVHTKHRLESSNTSGKIIKHNVTFFVAVAHYNRIECRITYAQTYN